MTTPPRPRRIRAGDAALLIPFALAALWLATGEATRALLVAGLGLVAIAARLVLGDRFRRGVAAVGRAVERGLEAIVGTLMWGVLVLPGWIASGRSGRRGGTGWRPPAASGTAERPFSDSSIALPVGVRALRGIGVLSVLVVADLLVGSLVLRVRDEGPGELSPEVVDVVAPDPRALAPGLVDSPWARTHLREIRDLPQGYWPYTLTRPFDVRGQTVNVDGWARRSHQSAAPDDDVPTIAFFGGSTTFGEGQRDAHTIPSEVARLAAADGLPVRVVNLGQRGWGAWQEALLFEQLTVSGRDRPDVAVFYDGATDVAIQAQPATRGSPSHLDVAPVRARVSGEGQPQTPGDRSVPGEVRDWVAAHSLTASVLRGMADLAQGEPAGAAGPSDAAPAPEVDAAHAVYRRARNVILATARARAIVPLFLWQPIRSPEAVPGYAASIDAPTVDLSHALDGHPEVFIDETHTDERGARLVAEQVWRALRDTVAAIGRGEPPPIPAPREPR